jgi:hypothetical protein
MDSWSVLGAFFLLSFSFFPPPLSVLLKEKIFSPFLLSLSFHRKNSSEEKEKGTLKINPTTT